MEYVYCTSISLMFLMLILSVVKRTSTYENLSLRPQTAIRLSSVYLEQYGSYAKDNNTSKDIKTCSHTDVGQAHASLTVDLGKQFRINAIKIFYRDQRFDEGTNRFDNFYLQVSQDMKKFHLCYNDTKPGLPPDEIDIPCEQTARYVVVNSSYDSPNDRQEGAILEICEIQVMGCELNTYGPNCELCGRCNNCDPRYGCSADCIHGYYGDRCTTRCSPGCKDSDCFPIGGNCKYGCKSEELIGLNCSECIDGYYRMYIYEYDSWNCKQCNGKCRPGQTCNKYTGECDDGCAPGLRGKLCNMNCIHGYYGDRCTTRCSPGCKDSDCFPIGGNCIYGCKSEELIGRNCSECIDGYYRIYSYEYDSLKCKQCTGGCKAGTTCNKYTGECDDGCKPGLRGRMCNITCHRGYFGQNCSNECYGCKDLLCDAVSGHCRDGCRETNLIGKTCSKCSAGYYVRRKWETGHYVYYCSECFNCLTKTTCDGSTGFCLDGCLAGWRGFRCTDRCGSGTYGVNCSRSCSRNCVAAQCNHISGDCDNQLCKGNWTGRKCDECKSGYYRADDTCIACSENCVKRSCNRSSGICYFGCESGWKGTMCQESAVLPPNNFNGIAISATAIRFTWKVNDESLPVKTYFIYQLFNGSWEVIANESGEYTKQVYSYVVDQQLRPDKRYGFGIKSCNTEICSTLQKVLVIYTLGVSTSLNITSVVAIALGSVLVICLAITVAVWNICRSRRASEKRVRQGVQVSDAEDEDNIDNQRLPESVTDYNEYDMIDEGINCQNHQLESSVVPATEQHQDVLGVIKAEKPGQGNLEMAHYENKAAYVGNISASENSDIKLEYEIIRPNDDRSGSLYTALFSKDEPQRSLYPALQRDHQPPQASVYTSLLSNDEQKGSLYTSLRHDNES